MGAHTLIELAHLLVLLIALEDVFMALLLLQQPLPLEHLHLRLGERLLAPPHVERLLCIKVKRFRGGGTSTRLHFGANFCPVNLECIAVTCSSGFPKGLNTQNAFLEKVTKKKVKNVTEPRIWHNSSKVVAIRTF